MPLSIMKKQVEIQQNIKSINNINKRMKNLNDFKVEELEQRLEMKKWTLKAAIGTETDTRSGVTKIQGGLRLTN